METSTNVTNDDSGVENACGTGIALKIAELLENPYPFSDVTFSLLQREEIQAHRLVLALRSEYFKKVFYTSRELSQSSSSGVSSVSTRETSNILINETNPKTFKHMIKFLYTDNISGLDLKEFLALAVAADRYGISDLFDICKSKLKTYGIFSLYDKAVKEGNVKFSKDLWSFILKNGEELLDTEDFLNVSHDTLCLILKQDDLNCDEFTICKAVVKWGWKRITKNPPSAANFRKVVGQALMLIRFPLIPLKNFKEFVRPKNILKDDEAAEIFRFHAIGLAPTKFSTRRRQNQEEKLQSINIPLKNENSPKSSSVSSRVPTDSDDAPSSRIKREEISPPSAHVAQECVSSQLKTEDFDESKDLPIIKLSQSIFTTPSPDVTLKPNEETPIQHPQTTLPDSGNSHTGPPGSGSNLLNVPNKLKRNFFLPMHSSSDESVFLPWTSSQSQQLNTPQSSRSERKRPKKIGYSASKIKNPRLVFLSSSQSSCSQSQDQGSSSSQKTFPASLKSIKKSRKKEDNTAVAPNDLKVDSNGREIQAKKGLIKYTNLMKEATQYSSSLQKISLKKVDIAEAYEKRRDTFGKVILPKLAEFNLDMCLKQVKLTCLSTFLKDINIEEYLFFICKDDINPAFVGLLLAYKINLRVNGYTILKVSPTNRSLTCSFAKMAKDMVENVPAGKSVEELAIGYTKFPDSLENFPVDNLRKLNLAECKFFGSSFKCAMNFIRRCSDLDELILNGFSGKPLNLNQDLEKCGFNLVTLALCNVIVKARFRRSHRVFAQMEKLVVYHGFYETDFVDDLETMFPNLRSAVFGGTENRPTFKLLKHLLKMKKLATIEIWNMDWDTTSLASTDDELQLNNLLLAAGISPLTEHFMLEKTFENQLWKGQKLKESEVVEKRFCHFKMIDYFSNEKALKDYEEFM